MSFLTNSELGRVITKPHSSGRLAKWAVELSEYGIQYQPRTAIKAQALANFLAEVPGPTAREPMEEDEPQARWQVFVDGSSRLKGSEVGIFLISPSGEEIQISIRLEYKASNNEAEYKAILSGMQVARVVGTTRISVYSDFQLATSQIQGTFSIKEDKMRKYAEAFKNLKTHFLKVQVLQIPWEENQKVDGLAQLASNLVD